MKTIQRFSALLLCLIVPAISSAQETAAPTTNSNELPAIPETDPLSVQDALTQMAVPDDLAIESVLSEPEISQPVFFNFDERGRMWVMNYLQYPYPAGLKMLSRDKFWRAVYDNVPNAPPHHTRGADKITIHEDTNGDGHFDSHKSFVDGLSIATSFVRGRGGVWVLNPPYLQFYPDADNDDVPDGDPVTHLAGFGIEDTHSCANSLRWGPDGWLYACQGSTVTGNVHRPGDDDKHHSLGQLIWRYHPTQQIYEVFAEGGGNAFGLEFDNQARAFSGHNGGDTRGFHYVQGGYYKKGFGKHGPLSNPFAFGYFEAMKHPPVQRFTHTFVIYQSDGLPKKYHGNLFGVEPMQGQIVRCEMTPDGSSFQTTDLDRPIKTDDPWFRPVDIKVGPDGAIYVADFYETWISHRDHFAGRIDKERGRIYRLKSKDSSPRKPIDYSKRTSAELAELLKNKNKWTRQTALRLLYDRRDESILPQLDKMIRDEAGQPALEALWAINASGGLNEFRLLTALYHVDPGVQTWAVRLMCDRDRSEVNSNGLSVELVATLKELAQTSSDVHLISQIAASARRLPAAQSMSTILSILKNERAQKFANDIHVPMLIWWAIEKHCEQHPEVVIQQLKETGWVWEKSIFKEIVATRLMQRFAQSGKRTDLEYCTALLQMASGNESLKLLVDGFENAFAGRSVAGLPMELNEALASAGGGSLVFRMRQNDPAAIEEALEQASHESTHPTKRIAIIETLGQIDVPSGIPLLKSLLDDDNADIQKSVLSSLQSYSQPEIAAAILNSYPKLNPDVQEVARSVLSSRPEWSLAWLEQIDSAALDPNSIPLDVVRKMTIHSDNKLQALIAKHWPNLDGASSAEMQLTIARVRKLIDSGFDMENAGQNLDPFAGKKIFTELCGKCHVMYGEGSFVGPELTNYNRSDTNNLLANIIIPSVEIREGFENYKIMTLDGRLLTGFIADEDNQVIVLRSADGQSITIARDDIDDMSVQKKSLMPDGLLKGLNDQQVRDLFAFIRSTQPLNER